MATKTFKIAYAVGIIFLLNSAGPGEASKQPPRAVSFEERTREGGLPTHSPHHAFSGAWEPPKSLSESELDPEPNLTLIPVL